MAQKRELHADSSARQSTAIEDVRKNFPHVGKEDSSPSMAQKRCVATTPGAPPRQQAKTSGGVPSPGPTSAPTTAPREEQQPHPPRGGFRSRSSFGFLPLSSLQDAPRPSVAGVASCTRSTPRGAPARLCPSASGSGATGGPGPHVSATPSLRLRLRSSVLTSASRCAGDAPRAHCCSWPSTAAFACACRGPSPCSGPGPVAPPACIVHARPPVGGWKPRASLPAARTMPPGGRQTPFTDPQTTSNRFAAYLAS